MLILAADPGLTGAICAYDTVEGRVTIHDMPVLLKQKSAAVHRVLDEVEILTLLGLYRDLGCKHFFVEQDSAPSPVENLTTSFNNLMKIVK